MSNGHGFDPSDDPILQEALRQEGLDVVSPDELDPVLRRALEQEGILPSAESAEEQPGLLDALLGTLSPGNIFDTVVAATPAPEIQALGRQLAEGDIEGFLRGEVEPGSGEAQFMALRETIGRGIGGSIANAINNALELSGELAADVGLTEMSAKVFDFTISNREDINKFIQNSAEEALRQGVPKRAVENALVTGNLIGFTVPLTLSMRAVSRIPVLGISTSPRAPFGVFAKDAMAGAVYGFTFESGSLRERGGHLLKEGALFGAFGAATVAPYWFFKTLRNTRLRTKLEQRGIDKGLERLSEIYDLETGAMRVENLDGKLGRTILEHMSEESYIARSEAGQRLLRNNADIEAIVHSIKSGSEAGATHVVIKNIADFEAIAPRLRRQFPNLKLHRVRHGDQIDIVMGHRGLSGQQLKQWKTEGRFEGQRILKDGIEYEYVGRASRKEYIKARRLDSNKTVELKDAGINDMPYGIPADLRAPGFEAITDEFVELILDRSAQIARGRDDFGTEAEVLQALREGELNAADFLKRDVAAQDVALYAEDFGLSAGGGRNLSVQLAEDIADPQTLQRLQEAGFNPFAFRVLDDAGQEVARGLGGLQDDVLRIGSFEAVPQQGREAIAGVVLTVHGRNFVAPTHSQAARKAAEALDIRPTDVVTPSNLIGEPNRFMTTQGRIVSEEQAIQIARNAGQPLEELGELRRFLEPDELLPTAQQIMNPLGVGGKRDVMRQITDMFPEIQVVRARGRQGEVVEKSIDRIIREEGLENVWRLNPDSPTAWRDLAELYLRDQELAGVADADAFAAYAAQRLRQRLWQNLPKEERQVLEGLRGEMVEILESEGMTFDAKAATLGFNTRTLDDGRVVLRDINSGAPLVFKDRAAAEEALQGMSRNFLEQGERVIPSFGGGFNTETTRGLDIPEGPIFEAADLDPSKASDIVANPIIGTVDVALQRIEEATGVPLWSKIIEPLDKSANLVQRSMARKWLPRLQRIWKDLSRKERIEVAEYIRTIEGKELTTAERRAIAQREGLSKKQVRAAEEQRELMLLAAQEFNIPRQDFIVNYYSRVVPYARQHGVMDARKIFPEGIPRSMEPWFRHQRTGEMPNVEMDPWVVQMKYFRAAEFERHMADRWERAWELVQEGNPFELNDLSRAQRAAVKDFLGGDRAVSALRSMTEEALANLRGFPTKNKDTVRRLSKRLMDKLNIRADERILEEYASVALSSLYGAALALRPRFVTRNFVQNLWFNWTRMGGRFAGEALERALQVAGFREAELAGAVRSQEAGIFLGSRVFDELLDATPLQGKNLRGSIAAAPLRAGLWFGRKARNASRRGLVNVSISDDFNRVWAFHWQRMHTEHWLRRYKSGEISEAKFLDEAFPGYSNTVKETFAERLKTQGEKSALDFAGKRAADENHFIYNLWSAPPWMQTRFGKLAGMFGRWPLGAIEVYKNILRYATPAQKAKFMARTAALAGAVQVTGHEMGIDLFSWIAPLSPLTYGGGPVLDYAFDAKEIVENSVRDPGRAKGAAYRLAQDVGRLSLPGQQFFRDMVQVMDANGTLPEKYLMMMLGRPADDFNFFSQVTLNPNIPHDAPALSPERDSVLTDSIRRQRVGEVRGSGRSPLLPAQTSGNLPLGGALPDPSSQESSESP